MNKFSLFSIFIIFSLLVVNLSSCVKENFDEPPVDDYPEVETNATIKDIKEFYVQDEYVKIDEDLIFSAVVVANDSSGNYFKSLVIQDETGGIELKINAVNLFNQFPTGRKIYINCKGLIISDYNELIQLGGNTYIENGEERLGGIEEILIDKYIVKGPPNQKTKAKEVTSFGDLTPDDQSTLVTLKEVQFIVADTSQTYADAANKITRNLTVENCNREQITLRTSGHADFAGEKVPGGKGSMTGIYSIFGTTKQFYIRSTSDVQLTGKRCEDDGGDCGYTEELISIKDLREFYQGSPTKAPQNSKIKGVVITDRSTENIHDLNLVLQDKEGYGILIRFGEDHSYNLGDEVEVVVHEADLDEYRGLLQLDNIRPSNSCSPGKGDLPTPEIMTVAELLNNIDRYESTLIKLEGAKISGGGGTYGGGLSVSDGTGTVEMFTRFDATFSDQAYPKGTVDITAIVSVFDDAQIQIRSTADVVLTDDGGGDDDLLSLPLYEDFREGIPSDWIVTNTVGSRVWEARNYDDYYYVQMGAFSNNQVLDVTTWLITPKIELEAQPEKSIEVLIADAFENGNPFRILYSTDYAGGNPDGASWTEVGREKIDPLINNPDTYDNNYESSGKIDLSMVSTNGHIAFVYESGGVISTTIQLYSVLVE